MFLALDTTLSEGQALLCKDNRIIAHETWVKAKSHSEVITENIKKILDFANIKTADLTALCCFNGPGSFTGIRVTISALKALGQVHQLNIYTQTTLFGMALNQTDPGNYLCLLDAQRNKLFTAEYKLDGDGNLLEAQPPQLLSPNEIEKKIKNEITIVGDSYHNFEEEFTSDFKTKIKKVILNNKTNLSLYACLAEAEKKHGQRGLTWQELQPMYLRASAAEEKFKIK